MLILRKNILNILELSTPVFAIYSQMLPSTDWYVYTNRHTCAHVDREGEQTTGQMVKIGESG